MPKDRFLHQFSRQDSSSFPLSVGRTLTTLQLAADTIANQENLVTNVQSFFYGIMHFVTVLNFLQRNSTQYGNLILTKLSLASPFTRVSYDYVFRSPNKVLTIASS